MKISLAYFKITLTLILLSFCTFSVSARNIYQNSFNGPGPSPYIYPYAYPPDGIDTNLTNSQWTVSSGTFTSYTTDNVNYALATTDATPETTTLNLSFDIAAGQLYCISGFSFNSKTIGGGYDTWDVYINNIDVATGSIFVDGDGSAPLVNTGDINLSSPIGNLTGTVNVSVVLSGGSHSAQGLHVFKDIAIHGDALINPNLHPVLSPTTNTPPPPLPAVAPGIAINGVFDVSGLGAASYSIPIKVPAGFNGMQPNLSLNYNSQAGNGIIGMGWTLGGISAITRISENIYNDNKVEGVGFNGNDRFMLDGSRLILTAGSPYGAPSTQYHTENESFKVITANGSLIYGPASFTVTDQNGLTYQYGETFNSLLLVQYGFSAYQWLLDKVTDVNGNYMTYEYNQYANGEVEISTIHYQANTNTGVTAQGYVAFSYTGRTDPQLSYIGGAITGMANILSSITCYEKSNGVWRMADKYVLNYVTDIYTHLSSISESGQDNLQSLSPTQFTYGTTASFSSIPHSELTQSSSPDLYNTFCVGDYNGDGKADLIQYSTQNNNSGFTLWQNQGAGTPMVAMQTGTLNREAGFGNQVNSLPTTQGQPFDYDGDGNDDFFYQQTNGNNVNGLQQKPWIYLSSGSAISPMLPIVAGVSNNNTEDIFGGVHTLTGDFDGDGKSEVLEIADEQWQPSMSLHWSYIIGKEYNTQQSSNIGQVLVPYYFNGVELPFSADNGATYYAIDYNGDGKTDILEVVGSTAKTWELNVTFDANHHPVIGSPAFNLVATTGYPTQWHTIFPGDFNGDHITDLLTYSSSAGWEIGYGKGNGLMNDIHPAPNPNMGPANISNGHIRPIFVGDFNGDGKSDIYDAASGSQSPTIYYSKGYNSFTAELPAVNTSQTGTAGDLSYWLGDFNGDGSSSIMSQGQTYDSNPNLFVFHPDERRHLITAIRDGLGAVTKITYGSLSNNAFYTKGSGYTYPYVGRTVPLGVVSNVNLDNGINAYGNDMSYHYSGLKYNAWGKGCMGYDVITKNDYTANATITDNFVYNTTYAYPYLASHTVMQGSNIITQSSFVYDTHNYNNGCIYSHPTQQTAVNNLTGETATTTYVYSTSGVAGSPGSWDIGKPMSITTDKGNSTEISSQYFTYPGMGGAIYTYSNPSVVTSTTTIQGSAPFTRSAGFTYFANGQVNTSVTDQGTANAVYTTNSYNAYGAVTQTVTSASGLASITKAQTYDASNRFAVKVYNTTLPSISAQTTFDVVTGNATSTTYADGFTSTNSYDAFGRLLSASDNTGKSAGIYYATAAYFIGLAPANAVSAVQSSTATYNPSYKYYDRLGRLLRTAYPGPNPFTNHIMIYEDITYNALGQVASKTKPYYSNSAPQTITYTYDGFGRLMGSNAPEGTTSISYTSGSTYAITTTDPAGHAKTINKNSSGRTVSVTDNGGALTYTYHSSGQPAQIKYGQNVMATFTYDAYGRKISQTDPNYGGSGMFQHSYNAYGQTLSDQDPHGNTYTYTYDIMGNLNTKTGPEGLYSYTYGYFAVGANCGKLIQLLSPAGAATHSYNYGMGDQILSETRATGTQTFTTAHSYDGYGRMATTTYPNGKQISYQYNPYDGSLQSIGKANSNISYYTCTDKNAFGQVLTAAQNNQGSGYALSTAYTYDIYGQMTEQVSSNPNYYSIYKDIQYATNPATGNLTQRSDIESNLQENFSYDNLDRLTSVTGTTILPGNTLFVPLNMNYAANGNITQKSDAGSFGYSPTNKIAAIYPYTTIPDDEQDITYTPFNKVATIAEAGNSAQFTYWADWTRSSMAITQNNTLLKTKYYAPNFEREIDGASNAQRDLCYINGPNGNIVAILETKSGVDKNYYVVSDQQGSILQIVDEGGAVIEEKSYDAWGRQRDPHTAAYLGPTFASNGWDRGYTGHEYIPQFGIINMNGRLYDPLMGRIYSPDDYVQAPSSTQGYNRYSYCLNNPLKYSDPSGEFIPELIGGIIGGLEGYEIGAARHDHGWALFGDILGGAAIGAASGGLADAVATSGMAFSATASIATGSFTSSVGFNILSEGKTPVSIGFGFGSYNLTNGSFDYLGKSDNTWLENVGYGLGAFANLSDAYGYINGAYGNNAQNATLHSNNHSVIKDVNGNDVLNVGATSEGAKDARSLPGLQGAFAKEPLVTDYTSAPDSWFARDQTILNVRLDAVSDYATNLASSGRSYMFAGVFGGGSLNCTFGASQALLAGGVLNIPIGIPGILSLQMYARTIAPYSYLFNTGR